MEDQPRAQVRGSNWLLYCVPTGPASWGSRSERGLGSLAQNTGFRAWGRRELELGLRQGRIRRNVRKKEGREGDRD